jgi:hypothetical protein
MKLFKKHVCEFNKLIYNIPRSNNTANVITKCKCGNMDHSRIHMDSVKYNSLIKTLI